MSVRQPVRPLSIENLTEAYPLELLADFSTGNFTLVKQDGSTVEHKKPGSLTVKFGSTTLLNAGKLTDALTLTIPADTSGNASTATALQTPRKIGITGGATGTAQSFDGSADINIPITSLDATKLSGLVPLASVPTIPYSKISDHPTIYQPSDATPKADGTASAGTSTAFSRADHIHPLQTTITGNAATATEFASEETITLSGDVSGSASSKAGWTINATLANSGVTAGSYGQKDNASPAAKGSFIIPYITVDAKGRVTAVANKTITLPEDKDTIYTHPGYTSRTSGLYKITVDATGHVSAVSAVAKADITGLGIPAQDTTYSDMTGATASAAGAHGLVPAPAAGKNTSFLRGDGTWAIPTDTTYSANKGITLTGTTFGHTNSITAGTAQGDASKTLTFGGTFTIPTVTYDAYGHITGKGTTTMTMPAAPTTITGNAATASKLADAKSIGLSGVTATAQKFDGSGDITIPVTAVPASLLTGTIDVARLPQAALERLIIVADDTARLALTSASAQNGDVVKVTATGLMYYIKDDSKLGTENAFESFTAGTASAVAWSGITNKPNFATVATSGSYSDLSNKPTIYQPSDAAPKADGTASAGTATTFSRADHIHPIQTTITGNAGSATEFAAAQTVALTGDVSGSASSKAGWSIATTLANSGVTAGSYGTSTATAPGYAKSFNIPYITVDAKGRVTAASNVAITMPTAYTHPAYTAKSSGLYKITVDATGHVSATAAVAKSDITALGIPAQDTVYTHPTHDEADEGLYKVTVDSKGHVVATTAVTKADITGLGIPAQDTVYTHPSHTAKSAGFYKVTVDALGHVTAATAVTKSDITGLGIPAQDTVYTHPSYTAKTSGLYKITVDATGHVSATAAVAKSDITALGIPAQDTTYSDMTGATASAAGAHGLVPAPAAGKNTSFLRGDGTWAIPTDTVYTHPSYTAKASGLYKVTVDATGHVSATAAVTKDDITALGIPAQDTVYTHPTYTAKTSGLYKVTVDSTGHVSATAAVAKSDITALGIPAQDTTYSDMTAATASAAGAHGLVPAPAAGKNTSFLRGDGTWAIPTDTTYTANNGITLTGTTFGHSNSITAGTAQGDATKTLTFGGTFTIPTVTYDAHGHITGKGTTTMTMPAAPTTITGNAATASKLAAGVTMTIGSTGKTFDGSGDVSWTLAEIGAAAAHDHPYLSTSGGTLSGDLTARNITVSSGYTLTVSTAGNVSGIAVKYNATIGTTWTGSEAPYTQTITVTGLKATDTPIVDMVASATYADSQAIEEAWGQIYRIVPAANTITVYSHAATTTACPIQLVVVR